MMWSKFWCVDLESSSLAVNKSDHYMMEIGPTEIDVTVSPQAQPIISQRCSTQKIHSKGLESKEAGNVYHNFTDDGDDEESSVRMDELKSTQETRYRNSHNHCCIHTRMLDHIYGIQIIIPVSPRYSILSIDELTELTETPKKKKEKRLKKRHCKKRRNSSKQCHRDFSSCTCGKCSIMAVFEHTCPRAYGALIPHLHGASLMSYYTSGFLLVPADNFWRVRNLPLLGGRGLALSLPFESQHSSIATSDEILLMDTQTRKYARDDYAVEDIPNTELQFSSLQTKINNNSTFECTKQKDTTDICDPHDLANLVLLLLLIAGDVEVNPGPQSERFRRLVAKLSDEVQTQHLQTQQCIIVSIHATLLPEAKGKLTTLEGLYNGLASSRKYCGHCDRILYCIVDLLSLNVTDPELQLLKEQADLQPGAVLNSRDIKFLKLLNFLSYEPKESLISANILPVSARGSTKDAAEIISGLIQTGRIAPTSASLKSLLTSVNNNELYQMKIKEALDAPVWMPAKPATVNLSSSQFSDLVVPDSPQPPADKSPGSKSLGGTVPHGSSGWTAPVIKKSDVTTTTPQLTLGDEPVSSPTIRELAIFPSLGDAWEDLGTALSISAETLKWINKKSSNSVKKQRELFRAYLKSNPNPTWSDIIDALVKIGKDDIARKVVDTFNLSSKLLATAVSQTSGKSIRPTSSLAKSRVEPDTAELESARVSKTEVHSSIQNVAKPHSSGKPFPKSRIESDCGTTLSAEDLSADKATVIPVPKRVSKTEIHSSKKLDHHPFDSSQSQPIKHRLASDGGFEETDSYFPVVERSSESSPSVDDGELKSIPTPFGSDPIKDKDGRSSISGSDGELSFRKESEPSSPKENSPSSDDFHSAEEMMPLDTRTTESDKYQQVVFGSHVSHRSTKRLRDSVLNANIEEIKRSIEESTAVVNFVLEVDSGHTALHIASKLGSKDVAKVLLQHKASVMVKDIKGCTPLYLAASSGNYEIAKLIIASPGCDMNTVSKDGTPLLYDPASKGFSMICELLLENGTNPQTETRTGMSPLYISSKNGHKDVVRILLKFGADVTRVCMETSKTPLQEAIDNEHIEVTKLLMKALTEVNQKNEKLFECLAAEKIHELIKHGASVDFRKANGSTPLIVHSSAGNKEVVQALIEEKANVDIQDNDGWSALMIASQVGHIEVVRSLIFAGAIPDLKNKEGLTALMCATLAAHINVIKELLLAKADPMLKRKDCRSAMEIAEQCGNQEIIATLKRHTTSSSAGNDPLFGLLGSYLELKKTKKQPTKNGEKAPHDHSMAVSLKRRESLSSLLPPLPGATAKDDASTAKQELEKCYKRIADLETRIHDLTLQSSIEVPSETDLAHLDERRLRDEYSKLKELKRKAELYAVEAKQTAQRLSAENAKLREDLNKERKYNELTRANIVREFEHKVSHGGEKSAKMNIVEKEIEERAQQFLRRMPQEKGTLKRVELKAVEIKEMIFEKRVTVNCLELAVMGQPGSGKSELLHRMLELKIDSTKQSSSLDFHQAVLCHDQYSDSHTWIKSAAEDCSVQPVSTALVKYLVCMHPTSSISGYMSGVVDPSNIVDEFSDFGLNRHFKVVLENVQKVAVQLESKGSLDVLKTSSLSIFNFANFKVGRVAHEISSALAIRSRNRVILNLVNLARYSPENVSLSDGEKSVGESSIQQGGMRPESALYKYMNAGYVSSKNHQEQQPRVILIGTHKDKINQGKLKELKKSIEQITQGYAESAGVADAICPGMECINTKDEKDYQRLQTRILELINRKHNFQCEIPISYLFLLSYLQSLQQMFISRKRLTEIAHSCDVIDEDEIEEFLEIFNNCGSIINYSNDEIPTLRDYIILNPYEFIKALDKLDSIKTMSFSDKLELFEQVDGTRLGFISEEMAAYLWPGEGEGRMTRAHFILTVLKEFMAILPSTSLQLETDIGKLRAAGGRFYFMPMLRAEYDKAEIQGDSNSLIITHNNAVLPFHLQTDMLLQIQNQFNSMITFDPKPYHNSICFKLRGSPQDQSEVNIVVHFHTELVKVSVQFPNQPPRMATVTRIYSHLKSACVQTFQLLSAQVKELKYDFTLVCPHIYGKGTPSLSAPGKNSIIHFISFDPLMAGEGKLFCQSCQLHVPSQKLPWAKLLWLQVAYQGPIKDINNPKGYLSNEQITMVCQSLASRLSLDAIKSFTKQLKSSKEEPSITTGSPFTGLESLLHFLIFAWKSRNPVNSVESLARILHTCGCYQEAMRLDPTVTATATADQEGHQPSLSDKEWSTIAAYLPQSVMKKLAESDPKGKVLHTGEAVSRKVAIRKLMELEYCSLAVALEIGWFS